MEYNQMSHNQMMICLECVKSQNTLESSGFVYIQIHSGFALVDSDL